MRIILTGKNGQVGFELQRALAPLGEVVAVDQHDCDLANPDAIHRLLAGVEPSVIVNPAAYTAVERAESEQELAQAIDGVAPGVLGDEAVRRGALVVHYSTDYVFHGAKDGAYSENDLSKQQGAYGKTNLAGERGLTIATADYPLPIPQPSNSRLDTSHLRQTFGLELPRWQSGLDHVCSRFVDLRTLHA